MGDELRLTLLGEPQLTLDGAPVTGFVYKKSVALLGYLAVTGRPHTRERLAGLLWSETTEDGARAGLRQVLADLRRQVPSYLRITRQNVALHREHPHWVDVAEFDRKVNEILERGGVALTEEDAAALAEAIELYRGDLFEGFHVHHALAFEEWILLERERLRLSMLRALHALSAHYAGHGDDARAIAYTARLLILEPTQEEAHRQMMSLLARSGQRDAALRQYDVCRQVLAKELDVAPAEETVALYERIHAESGTSPPPRPPCSVPAPLTALVGREAELSEIAQHLQDPACRLLTLVGPGGSGKTHLAQVAAAGQRDRFPHGVYWIPLASLDTPEEIVPATAQALGLPFHGEGSPQEQLLAFVRRKRMLLLMDNMEHLLESADLVIDLLRAAPHVKILVTSRTKLNVGCEQLLPVTGLSCPQAEQAEPTPECLQEAARHGAVQLFLAGARRMRPGLVLADDDLLHIARVCHIVDGLPLAILLAAGWMEALSPLEIAAQLCGPGDDGLDFLSREWRDLPQRQRSMRAVYDRSWRLLSVRAREVFQALSVFRGGFTREVAWQVTGALPGELMTLVNKSFLQQTVQGRYGVHELLRRYAGEQLARSPAAEEAVRDRHCATYAALVQGWGEALKGADQRAALDRMVLDLENARAAWEWAIERRKVDLLDRAVEGLCRFYQWVGRFQDGAFACQAATDRLGVEARGDALRVRAKVLAWQAVLCERAGRTRPAARQLRQSLALLEERSLAAQDVRPERAFAMLQLGYALRFLEREEAGALLQGSLELYWTLGDRWRAAHALEHLGWIAMMTGAHERARQLYEESLALWRALGDRRGIAQTLHGLSIAAQNWGELAEGVRFVQESIAIRRELGARAEVASGLSVLGPCLMNLGQLDQARSALEESIQIYDELGLCPKVAKLALANARTLQGAYAEARAEIESVPLDPTVDNWRDIGLARLALGMAALGERDYGEAQQRFEEGLSALRKTERLYLLSSALAFLARAELGLGETAPARGHVAEALRISVEARYVPGAFTAVVVAALLLAEKGAVERAVALWAMLARHTSLIRLPWYEDVFGKHILAAAASLPPELAAAARERGRAQDGWETAATLLAELSR